MTDEKQTAETNRSETEPENNPDHFELDGETAAKVLGATEAIHLPDELADQRTVIVSMESVIGGVRPVEIPGDAYDDPVRGPETFRKEYFETCYVLLPPIGSRTWTAIKAVWERSIPRGIGEPTETAQ